MRRQQLFTRPGCWCIRRLTVPLACLKNSFALCVSPFLRINAGFGHDTIDAAMKKRTVSSTTTEMMSPS